MLENANANMIETQKMKETLEYIQAHPRGAKLRRFLGIHKNTHDEEIFDKVSFIVRHHHQPGRDWLTKFMNIAYNYTLTHLSHLRNEEKFQSLLEEIDNYYAFVRDKETVRYFLDNPARRELRYVFKRYKLSHNKELFKALNWLKSSSKKIINPIDNTTLSFQETIDQLKGYEKQNPPQNYIRLIQTILTAYQTAQPTNRYKDTANLSDENYEKIANTIQYLYENPRQATLRHIYDLYKGEHDEGLFRYLLLLAKLNHPYVIVDLQKIFNNDKSSEAKQANLDQLITIIKYYFNGINSSNVDPSWKKLFKKPLNLFFDQNDLKMRLVRPRTLKENLYRLKYLNIEEQKLNNLLIELKKLADSTEEYVFIEEQKVIDALFNKYEIAKRRQNKKYTTALSYIPTASVAIGEGGVAGGLLLQALAPIWMVISAFVGGALTNWFLLKDDNREVFLEITARDKIFKDANGKPLAPFKKGVISSLIFWTITSGVGFACLAYYEAIVLLLPLIGAMLATSVAGYLALNTFIVLTTLIYYGLVIEIKNFGFKRMAAWFQETFGRRDNEHWATCIVRGFCTGLLMGVMIAISLATLAVTAIFLGKKAVDFFKNCVKVSPKIVDHGVRMVKSIMWAASAAFSYLSWRKLQKSAHYLGNQVGTKTESIINATQAKPIQDEAPKKSAKSLKEKLLNGYVERKINPYKACDEAHSLAIRTILLPAIVFNAVGQGSGPAKMINLWAGILFGSQSATLNFYNGMRGTASLSNDAIANMPAHNLNTLQAETITLEYLKDYTHFFLAMVEWYVNRRGSAHQTNYQSIKKQLTQLTPNENNDSGPKQPVAGADAQQNRENYCTNAKKVIDKEISVIKTQGTLGLFGEKGSGVLTLFKRYQEGLESVLQNKLNSQPDPSV